MDPTISDFSNLDRSCGFLLLFAMAGQKIQVFCRSTDLVWRVGEYHIQNTGNWIPVKHCYIRGMAEGSTEGDWKLLHPVEKARWQQYDWAEEESDGWFPDRVRIEYEHFKESEPSPTARHVSVLFCNLEEDRTTAEKEIHFNFTFSHPYCRRQMQNYCWWEIRKLKMRNPSEIYASSKSCNLEEDRNGVLAARQVNEQKWDCASGFVRCGRIQ